MKKLQVVLTGIIRSRVKLVDKLFLYQKLLIINELKYFHYFVKQYLLMFYKLKTS